MTSPSSLPAPAPRSLARSPQAKTGLIAFSRRFHEYLVECDLPTEGIFQSVAQRDVVLANLPGVLDRLTEAQRRDSLYLSKFLAAVAVGLFDAALNYLWDQTVAELRRRVEIYDLSYFYDSAVPTSDKRKSLKDASDLSKLDDSELINGARQIGLISDMGFRHLDYIRFMRNWASAAHPNQNALTGLQLVSWLETCITEVISLPLSEVTVEIRRLLANIRAHRMTEEEAGRTSVFFANLPQEQVNNLASAFFGIHTRSDSSPEARDNVRLLAPLLWDRVAEPTRQELGVRYGRFVANNDQPEKQRAREFLTLTGAAQYVPEGLRAYEIDEAIQALLDAHRGFNNFHTEPPLVRELDRLVTPQGNVPKQVVRKYVWAVVETYVTNGNGVTRAAEPTLKSLLERFDSQQGLLALVAFLSPEVSSKLQFDLCQSKFRELMGWVRVKLSAPVALELLDTMQAFSGPLDKIHTDSNIKRKLEAVRPLLN